jgi:cell division protein FtsB
MVRAFFSRIAHFVSSLLNQPTLVAGLCLLMVTFGLVLDGSLLRLWSLHRDAQEIEQRITKTETQISRLRELIRKAQDPQHIEQQARERLDLVGPNDLVFVFSDDDNVSNIER